LIEKLRVTEKAIAESKILTNKEENTKLKEKIVSYNGEIADFKSLNEQTPHWSKVVEAFSKDIPPGVKVSQATFDVSKKKVDINGFAPTRDLVLQLHSNISEDKKSFFNVDYPLENVARPTNVKFHFTFYIQDSLLK
jgi:hypothetical protein